MHAVDLKMDMFIILYTPGLHNAIHILKPLIHTVNTVCRHCIKGLLSQNSTVCTLFRKVQGIVQDIDWVWSKRLGKAGLC